MKHKKCPQCKNLISVNAPTCLYCGRPNKFVTNTYVKTKWYKEYNNQENIIKKFFFNYKLIIFFILLIIIFISLQK